MGSRILRRKQFVNIYKIFDSLSAGRQKNGEKMAIFEVKLPSSKYSISR